MERVEGKHRPGRTERSLAARDCEACPACAMAGVNGRGVAGSPTEFRKWCRQEVVQTTCRAADLEELPLVALEDNLRGMGEP